MTTNDRLQRLHRTVARRDLAALAVVAFAGSLALLWLVRAAVNLVMP